LQEALHSTNCEWEYKHDNGEISQVEITMAGIGSKRVRIVNILPKISDGTVRYAFSNYGEIQEIQEERWSKAYRYSVSNGIRIVVIALTKHIPSHMTIAGNRVLVSHEGQPMTCYGCGDTGNLYPSYPKAARSGSCSDTKTHHILRWHYSKWNEKPETSWCGGGKGNTTKWTGEPR
jgi:hypothetical protein